MENLLPIDGEAYYFPDFFSKAESDQLFRQLQEEIAWKQESIQIYGKQVLQPRLTALYGEAENPYTYSGLTLYPTEWTASLQRIKQPLKPSLGSALPLC